MNTSSEILRRLENLIRLGVITEITGAKCRVKTGGLVTKLIPWFALRAGEDADWNPPSLGEQCMVFSPSGDPALGVALLGIFSNTFPAPDDKLTRRRRTFSDGAVIDYDTETHELKVVIPAGGTITIVGDVHVTGDVVASNVSLATHKHGGVARGNGATGVPE